MDTIQVCKKILRNEIKQKIASLSSEYKKQQSELIVNKLFESSEFKNSKRISVYLSTKDEVNTEPILKKIFEKNKTCFIPRYNSQTMEMVKLDSMLDYDTLPITKWNIKQPDLNETRENAMHTGGLQLIIIPGVAFTTDGVRMGHGKGYYDTFLSNCEKTQKIRPKTIALAFKEQIVDHIPTHDHDVLIDLVLYPK